jgi:hypothetical protein
MAIRDLLGFKRFVRMSPPTSEYLLISNIPTAEM